MSKRAKWATAILIALFFSSVLLFEPPPSLAGNGKRTVTSNWLAKITNRRPNQRYSGYGEIRFYIGEAWNGAFPGSSTSGIHRLQGHTFTKGGKSLSDGDVVQVLRATKKGKSIRVKKPEWTKWEAVKIDDWLPKYYAGHRLWAFFHFQEWKGSKSKGFWQDYANVRRRGVSRR